MGISRCQSLPNVRELISAQLDQQPDYQGKPADDESDNSAPREVHGATVHAGQRFLEMMAAMQLPLGFAPLNQDAAPSSDELWDWSAPTHVLPSEVDDEMWDWAWGSSEYEECQMQEDEEDIAEESTMQKPSEQLREIVWYWQTYHATAEPRSALERHEDEMWTWGSTFPVDEFDKWGQPRQPCAHSHWHALSQYVRDEFERDPVHSMLTC